VRGQVPSEVLNYLYLFGGNLSRILTQPRGDTHKTSTVHSYLSGTCMIRDAGEVLEQLDRLNLLCWQLQTLVRELQTLVRELQILVRNEVADFSRRLSFALRILWPLLI